MIAVARRGRSSALWGTLTVTLLLTLSLPNVGVAIAPIRPSMAGPTPIQRLLVAPGFVPPRSAVDLGPLPRTTILHALVGLAPRDPAGLAARVALSETPGNPLFRSFLTPSEVLARFGPTPASIDRATSLLRSSGLTVHATADGLFLRLDGPAGGFQGAFQTRFESYRIDGSVVFAHPIGATLPGGLPWTGALGLGNTSEFRPAIGPLVPLTPRPSASSCPASETSQGFIPCQLDRAYNATSLVSAGTNGTGYRLAVVDAYDSSEPQRQLSKDLASFTANYSLPATAPQFVYPVPTSRNLNSSSSSGWSAEEALDLEWARASAPGATLEMVLSPDPSVGLYESVDWLVAHQAADVISLSWSEPDVGVYNAYAMPCPNQCNATSDGSYTLLHPVLQEAAAEGIGVFAATGDCGAAAGTSGVSTGYPASDPYVTGVGGSVLNVDSAGNWSSEGAWSGNDSGATSPGCLNQGGSGGGFSPYPRPLWQSGPGIATNQTHRGEPDVAFNAGQPVAIYLDGSNLGVGGTSAGTPMWAGFELIADQLNGARLGSLNPSLYALARTPSASTMFHDVRTGGNGYPATAGWDPVTGLGTPLEDALAPALVSSPPPLIGTTFATLTATPRLGPAPLTVGFNLADTQGGLPPTAFVDVSFGDGNATLLPPSTPNGSLGQNVTYHAYPTAGVYAASATYVDASGNSSTSPPVVIVVGGGKPLNVSLHLSNATPSVGGSVTFSATIANGVAPYHYDYYFGDGTYALNRSVASLSHTFGADGSLCAEVVVRDSASPTDGGSSVPLPVSVGGAPVQSCDAPTPMTASFSSARRATDLPGDFPLSVVPNGGTAPYSIQYVSDDPYVRACDCGIFRTLGNHRITAFVNDSFSEGVVRTLNVTTYPALTANASASGLTGPAPFSVNFSIPWAGGHFTGPAVVRWSFGDGASTNGSTNATQHTYPAPGEFLATVDVADQGGGNASAAWLVDVLGANGSGLSVSGSLLPRSTSTFGGLFDFQATATGGTAPYQYRWSFGQNDSAFGSAVDQSYSPEGCSDPGPCPITVGLTVNDSRGTLWTRSLMFLGAMFTRSSGVRFSDGGEVADGVTPYPVALNASATGVVGLKVGWWFGDGATANGSSVAHSYYDPGNYTIVETATDPFGDSLVRSHAIRVTGVAVLPLVGTALANVSVGLRPLPVEFTTVGSGGAGAPYTVNWTFGDGFYENGPTGTLNHTYRVAGRITAVAHIRDGRGDALVLPVNLTIYDVTFVDLNLTISPQPAQYAEPVTFAVRSSAECSRTSVPGCGNDSEALRLFLSYSNLTLQGATPVSTPVPPLAGGTTSGRLPSLGTYSGPVFVWVVAVGPNYTGAAIASVVVQGGACGCPGRVPTIPADILFGIVLGATTGGGALIALIWRSRRRPPRELPPGHPYSAEPEGAAWGAEPTDPPDG